MRLPRPPDWLIYLSVAGLVLWVAARPQWRDNAPAPPPPVPGEEAMPLGPASPFNPAGVVRATARGGKIGTAFSVSDQGLWLTARHVVEGCPRVVLLVSEGRGVATDVSLDPDADLAVLTTDGGAPALPLVQTAALPQSARGYHPGFPHGTAGEVTSRYVGRQVLPGKRRGEADQPVLAWAEAGRTEELTGTLDGLSGSPVLDAAGRVVGVTLAEASRRGLIYTTGPEAIARALASIDKHASPGVVGEAVTPENYGRVADTLRRTLSVARVLCLSA